MYLHILSSERDEVSKAGFGILGRGVTSVESVPALLKKGILAKPQVKANRGCGRKQGREGKFDARTSSARNHFQAAKRAAS